MVIFTSTSSTDPYLALPLTHFASSHTENFCAALLLAVMEVEPRVRALVAVEVRRLTGDQDQLGELVSFHREEGVRLDGERGRRGDLWLRYRRGEYVVPVVVEVKTRWWKPERVVAQVHRYEAGRSARTNEPVHSVVLLAPSSLCADVKASDKLIPVLTWSSLLSKWRDITNQGEMSRLAIAHLERTVEIPIGLEKTPAISVKDLTCAFGCLREFLHACIGDLGGRSVRDLALSRPDGEPYSKGDWAWYGMSARFKIKKEKGWLLGIYEHVKHPKDKGSAEYAARPKLEVFKGEQWICAVSFDPVDLRVETLAAKRRELVEAWRRAVVKSAE